MALYAILDTALLARHQHRLVDVVEACGDLPWVQIRHKGPFDRDFVTELEACARIRTDLILNDRADYAALFGFGLHLGQDDLPPVAARQIIGTSVKLGLSTHNATQLLAGTSEPVDYLAVGPIFETSSKLNPDPVVGVVGLARLRPISTRPLVAIGGITLENAPQVIEAGANFVAILSALWQPPYTLRSFRDNIERWQQTLATPN